MHEDGGSLLQPTKPDPQASTQVIEHKHPSANPHFRFFEWAAQSREYKHLDKSGLLNQFLIPLTKLVTTEHFHAKLAADTRVADFCLRFLSFTYYDWKQNDGLDVPILHQACLNVRRNTLYECAVMHALFIACVEEGDYSIVVNNIARCQLAGEKMPRKLEQDRASRAVKESMERLKILLSYKTEQAYCAGMSVHHQREFWDGVDGASKTSRVSTSLIIN